jgi:FkbM family methyltransferase
MAATLTSPADARARFLQVVAEGLGTVLPDNIDHHFWPYGQELPDPAAAGERIAAQLEVLERCATLWERLGDDASRELLLRFFAYRALGPAHVRLQLEPGPYRKAIQSMTAQAAQQTSVLGLPGNPFDWQLHLYDLRGAGIPLRVVGPPLPLASTMLFSQYAYRDAAAGAAPRAGDIALDVGGCWGDTALWLANVVGPAGAVHTFEPTPQNRALLEQNLALNPELRGRIRVHAAPLAAQAGEVVHMRDTLAAGSQIHHGAGEQTVEMRTDTVDDMVAAGDLPRVDFLKVDVEGADLGVLEGAANTIASQRPRLAIACYHKPDDLAVIPDYVASLGVEYRWYLQCSTMTDIDTVAFAVPA